MSRPNEREAHTATRAPSGAARFPLGRTMATPGALEALDLGRGGGTGGAPSCGLVRGRLRAKTLFDRHACGDWGGLLDAEDVQANEDALTHGARLLSKYELFGASFYIITEWDRSVTTLLLCEEY